MQEWKRAFNVELGARIKQVREEKGLSRTKIFNLTGVHWGAMRDVENGDSCPSLHTIAKIAFALGVPMTELIPDFDVSKHPEALE